MIFARFVMEDTSGEVAEEKVNKFAIKNRVKVYKIVYTGEPSSLKFFNTQKKNGLIKRHKPYWKILDEKKFLEEIESDFAFRIVESFVEGKNKETKKQSTIEMEGKNIEGDNKKDIINIHKQENNQLIEPYGYMGCQLCKRIGFALLEKEKNQETLAKEVGVTQPAISQHINNHFPQSIKYGTTKGAYLKLTPQLHDYFADLKESEEVEIITERKLRNMRYDVFTDSIFWSAIVLIEDGISIENLRLSLNGIKDENEIKRSLVNTFRVMTVDNIIEIGAEEVDWIEGKSIKKWVGYTSKTIHTLNEENINLINSKTIRVKDIEELRKYQLIGISINTVRGRTNLLDFWINDFVKMFEEKKEALYNKVMQNIDDKIKKDEFTEEYKRKAIHLSKAIKGELFNASFLERYLQPNNPDGIYFRNLDEINQFLDEIGAEFNFVATNPSEKPYLQHKP